MTDCTVHIAYSNPDNSCMSTEGKMMQTDTLSLCIIVSRAGRLWKKKNFQIILTDIVITMIKILHQVKKKKY